MDAKHSAQMEFVHWLESSQMKSRLSAGFKLIFGPPFALIHTTHLDGQWMQDRKDHRSLMLTQEEWSDAA